LRRNTEGLPQGRVDLVVEGGLRDVGNALTNQGGLNVQFGLLELAGRAACTFGDPKKNVTAPEDVLVGPRGSHVEEVVEKKKNKMLLSRRRVDN